MLSVNCMYGVNIKGHQPSPFSGDLGAPLLPSIILNPVIEFWDYFIYWFLSVNLFVFFCQYPETKSVTDWIPYWLESVKVGGLDWETE